jgi:ArsR family transcriptional regulator, arsenate/arsenite/antimonite-responsive transcriptional repressor
VRDDLRHARTFRALGNPIRLGILLRLAEEPETCACDFTEHFGVSQPTLSGHLRALREVGLVVTERRGAQICYSLAPEGVAEVARILARLARAA